LSYSIFLFFIMLRPPPRSTLLPYTTLFRSDTFRHEIIVDLWNRILYRHRNVLLRNLRRRTRPTITTVDMDDVRSSIVAPNRHHIHIRRRRHLHRHKRAGIHRLEPVNMLLVILHRIDTMKRKRRVKTSKHRGLPHLRNLRRHLVSQQMPAETRLRALSILELDNRRVLYRLLPNPEHPRRHLRNHMIPIRNNSIRITTLTSRRVRPDFLRRPRPRQHEVERNRSKRHTPTINRQRNLNFPTFSSLVQGD